METAFLVIASLALFVSFISGGIWFFLGGIIPEMVCIISFLIDCAYIWFLNNKEKYAH